jgi:hypothetical protein
MKNSIKFHTIGIQVGQGAILPMRPSSYVRSYTTFAYRYLHVHVCFRRKLAAGR